MKISKGMLNNYMNAEHSNLFSFGGNFYTSNLRFGFIRLAQICEIALTPGSGFSPPEQVCHEITYIVSGSGIFRTGSTEFRVRQGTIHVIARGDIHEIIVPPTESLRYICIGFNFDEIPEGFRDIAGFYEKSPRILASGGNDIGCLFEMLIGEFYNTRENHDTAVGELLKLILLKVRRRFTEDETIIAPERGIGNRNTVYKVLKYIDSHAATVKSVGEISRKLNYTESYISTVFRQKMGVTLQSYIRDKKLETAKMLLEYGNRTVNDVAELMNFENVQSFSKSFKKKYGITPHMYLGKR